MLCSFAWYLFIDIATTVPSPASVSHIFWELSSIWSRNLFVPWPIMSWVVHPSLAWMVIERKVYQASEKVKYPLGYSSHFFFLPQHFHYGLPFHLISEPLLLHRYNTPPSYNIPTFLICIGCGTHVSITLALIARRYYLWMHLCKHLMSDVFRWQKVFGSTPPGLFFPHSQIIWCRNTFKFPWIALWST